jgi:hypothetical protein
MLREQLVRAFDSSSSTGTGTVKTLWIGFASEVRVQGKLNKKRESIQAWSRNPRLEGTFKILIIANKTKSILDICVPLNPFLN